MLCEIARGLDETRLDEIRRLEGDIGLPVVAFACRTLDPAREERLKAVQEEVGPPLAAEPAEPTEAQLAQIRELESKLGLSLVAVRLEGGGGAG